VCAVTSKLKALDWVDIQVTTCRGWGHIVVAALQTTQLVTDVKNLRKTNNVKRQLTSTGIVCNAHQHDQQKKTKKFVHPMIYVTMQNVL